MCALLSGLYIGGDHEGGWGGGLAKEGNNVSLKETFTVDRQPFLTHTIDSY